MPNDRLRVGIIGASAHYGWGQRAHMPAILALPELELVAVCTAHRETAEESARRYGARLAFHDYRALATHPDVDLVVVCVRANRHYEMVKVALQAGKHVFCEWPIGAQLGPAVELAALARQQGVRTMVGLNARGSPAILHLRDLIAQGYVGQPLACNMTMAIERYPGYRTPKEWAADPEKGSRVLWIHAGHSIDAFCFCVGEFRELSGLARAHIPDPAAVRSTTDLPPEAPDAVIASGVLENGTVATVSVMTSAGHTSGWRMEVIGAQGTLIATAAPIVNYGEVCIWGAKAGQQALEEIQVPAGLVTIPTSLPPGPPYNVAQLYRRFAQAVRDGSPAHPDFDDAVRRHRLLHAIQVSSHTGQRQIVTRD